MVGVFGSAFNPPTRGHLDAICQALDVCDEVWLVPSIDHAFGKAMLPFSIRWQMLSLFTVDIADPRVIPVDVEVDLWDGQTPVFTVDVLGALQERHPDREFRFLCGPDNAEQFHRFAKADEIRQRWGLMTLQEHDSIRSTLVRDRRQARLPVSEFVTPSVNAMIKEMNLYE